MSMLSIALLLLGTLILITRGPLVYAPDKTRARLVSLFDTQGKMRTLGIVFAVFGGFLMWAADGSLGGWAVFVYLFGVVAILVSLVMILSSARMQAFATKMWNGFGETTLRLIGLTSTAFAAWLLYVGVTL